MSYKFLNNSFANSLFSENKGVFNKLVYKFKSFKFILINKSLGKFWISLKLVAFCITLNNVSSKLSNLFVVVSVFNILGTIFKNTSSYLLFTTYPLSFNKTLIVLTIVFWYFPSKTNCFKIGFKLFTITSLNELLFNK